MHHPYPHVTQFEELDLRWALQRRLDCERRAAEGRPCRSRRARTSRARLFASFARA